MNYLTVLPDVITDRIAFEPNSGCWLWTGDRTRGYGTFRLASERLYAHRLVHMLTRGPIPADKPHVCHTCDTPLCVNPAHLWCGTNADNRADSVRKGRHAYGDRSGSRTHPERLPRGDRNSSRLHPERLPHGADHWTHKYPERRRHGEHSPRAKLTAAQVQAIRVLYAEGHTQRAIAAVCGVHEETIRATICGLRYRNVP